MIKQRENNSYQVYIELCYSYVLVFLFFFKVRILFIFCFSFGIKNPFCHMTIATIRRQHQGGRHEI